jgi:hypothetical protein
MVPDSGTKEGLPERVGSEFVMGSSADALAGLTNARATVKKLPANREFSFIINLLQLEFGARMAGGQMRNQRQGANSRRNVTDMQDTALGALSSGNCRVRPLQFTHA